VTTFAQGASSPAGTEAIYATDPQGAIGVLPATNAYQGYTAAPDPVGSGVLVDTGLNASTYPGSVFTAAASEEVDITSGLDFFEDFHVVPRVFELGQLLSAQSLPIEVFNAHRALPAREWTSLTNNAGTGVSLGGQPALPVDVDPLYSVQMTLDVAIAGDPVVVGDLTFVFSGVGTIVVPITLQRIVLFGVRPELPFSELLRFLTDVRTSKDGSEKRQRVRSFPRQAWQHRFLLEEGAEAQRIELAMVEYQSRTWGLPVWDEDSALTVAAAAGATTITVNATAWRDFREGGFVVIFTDAETFDVLEIDTGGITATTLTFTSPTVNAYAIGTEVFPMATCRLEESLTGGRYPVNLRTRSIEFTSIENVVDLADLSAFNSFNGRLFLDNGNSALSATVGFGSRQRFVVLDGETGEPYLDRLEDRAKPDLQVTLRAFGRQAKWELRQLIHAIGGRHVSWYVPTEAEDLELAADVVNATSTIDVVARGYAQFVRHRKPYNAIRLVLTDGTTVERLVTDSTSVSTTVDRLTVSTPWAAGYAVADVARIDFVLRVRFDTDDLKLRHVTGDRAYLVAPVVGVFD